MLANRNLPADLKAMNTEELSALCEEIRQEIVATCLKNGGHLGASLGTVEIAVALHRIFDSPKDKLVWDVGHQAYAHKLLTGRAARFGTLRTHGGLSGFLAREESAHDVFGAGHSSTSLSAALGFAYRSDDWTVAVIGDGGLTAGVAFEAMNNIQSPNHFGPLLVILNDNQMSISENVGGIHHLLSNGQGADYFHLFGFDYVGPASGHDLPTLLATLNGIREARPARPILLHLMTQKGKGYSPAEARPALYHGVGPAQPSDVSGKTAPSGERATSTEKAWSDLFCSALIRAAEKDPKIVAITAAMSDGTGLLPFASRFPDRFFDVGIAEPHAATFAAGLAANGWKPVCAIYSTFLQRSFDAIIHDIALQNLPVVFAVDRAGLVGADGPTHHGVFDLAYTGLIPGTRIYTPEVAGDLEGALGAALTGNGAAFIRYPRGKAAEASVPYSAVRRGGASVDSAAKKVLISYGPIGVRVKKILSGLDPSVTAKVAHFSVIEAKPTPNEVVDFLEKNAGTIVEAIFFEDGVRHGSLSVDVASRVPSLKIRTFTYPDRFLPHGNVPEIEREFGRTDEAIAQAIRAGL
ncbi:MAG: 1-deoxy-D-xylulose-5-phosphate synthase [Bdellovibrionales bacterium]|nr:1-deoxy-D-xylulose-5-phosphate synthase [Bdellovibrionales bacterium]